MKVFKFTEEQLAPYRKADPNWGEVGVVTYKRTYSRETEGKRREDWLETLTRVIEGSVELGQKIGDPTATEEWALEALEYFFHMSVMPPGRGYWMMGTGYSKTRGGDALNNCWYVDTAPHDYENMEMFKGTWGGFSQPEGNMPSFPFVFMFDRAMLGGGVGFGINKRNMKKYPNLTTELNLKIVLSEDHPDWDRIRASEEWVKFDLAKYLISKAPESEGLQFGYHHLYKAEDTREGWDVCVREAIDAHWYKPKASKNPAKLVIDLSDIREYGAPIKSFGGTASGPLPLIAALVSINTILNSRVGKNLRGVDAMDIMNILGRCVVSGNVRRTALITIGDADDKDYVDAKNYTLVDPILEKGEDGWPIWFTNDWGRLTQKLKDKPKAIADRFRELCEANKVDYQNPYALAELQQQAEEEMEYLYDLQWKQDNHRWASNNSVYTNEMFKDHHFIAAGIIANGEPGIVNEWLTQNFGRIIDGYKEGIDAKATGTNPCGEISLASGENCNLVEFVPYRAKLKGHNFQRCLTIAAQYTYRITFAEYMWPITRRIVSEHRRIGVAITGAQDYFLTHYGRSPVLGFELTDNEDKVDITRPIFYKPITDELDQWYKWVKEANEEQAKAMGANPSIKITTVKPSGTVAKLPGVSSGIHWHYAPYMIQRIRFNETDSNLKVMEMAGLPIEKAIKEPNTMIVEFPIKNPNSDHPLFRSAGDIPLEEQFANQFMFAKYWADNAVSATLTFKHDETDKIEPLLKHYGNLIKSTSLLPYTGHGYVQAPWEPIEKEEYERRVAQIKIKPEEVYRLMDEAGISILGDEGLDSDCIGGACPVR